MEMLILYLASKAVVVHYMACLHKEIICYMFTGLRMMCLRECPSVPYGVALCKECCKSACAVSVVMQYVACLYISDGSA